VTVSSAQLAELRDAQLAYVARWLRSPDAESAWCALAQELRDTLVRQPLNELLERELLDAALMAAQQGSTIEGALLPGLRAAIADGMARVHSHQQPASELLSESTASKLNELVADPEVVSEPVLRALLTDPALEAVMHDVLFEALKEFGERVNPFVAPWGLPALLDSLPVLAKGPVKKALAGVRAEFERRSEPETRKFLQSFARRAVAQSIDHTLSKGGEPEFVALRQHLVTAVLEQPLSELCWSPNEERGRRLSDALVSAASDIATNALVVAATRHALDELFAAWGERPIGELLHQIGVTLPPVDPFARAAWPALRAALSSDPMTTLWTTLIEGAHAEWARSQAPPLT